MSNNETPIKPVKAPLPIAGHFYLRFQSETFEEALYGSRQGFSRLSDAIKQAQFLMPDGDTHFVVYYIDIKVAHEGYYRRRTHYDIKD